MLMKEPLKSAQHHTRDAMIALDSNNFSGAYEGFCTALTSATKAFNLSKEPKPWVVCTELRVTAFFMKCCYHNGRFVQFYELPKDKRTEIGLNLKAFLDDLLDEIQRVKSAMIDKAVNAPTFTK